MSDFISNMTLQANRPDTPNFIAMNAVPLNIEAASGDGAKLPHFSMVAYTGGVMRVGGFRFPVAVDFQGLEIRQSIPIRLNHDANKGVGHSTRIAVEAGQLVAEGLISRDTQWAKDVVTSGVNGFPWQASIGADIKQADFVRAGATVTVNGKTFDGPIYVVRKAQLREISFVDNGADSNTTAKIAAKENSEMNFSQWLEAKGFGSEADFSEEQIKTLKAAYEAEVKAAAGEDADGKDAPAKNADGGEDKKVEAAADDHASLAAAAARAELEAGRKAAAEETKRIAAIRKLCAGNHGDIEAEAIEKGWDESKTELHILRAERPTSAAIHITGNVGGENNAAVIEAAALMSAGYMTSEVEASYNERTLEAASNLRGVGLREMCDIICGHQLPNYRRDPSGWLQAAFSTTSLPGILSNLANKMLLEGYNYAEDVWRMVVKIATVNDFKQHTRYRMNGDFKFLPVGPDGELKHGKLSEQTFTNQASTSGLMFSITREMIINDDLGAFAALPYQIGMGAGEAINDAVWELILSNPTQSDGKAFFHADHKNYIATADSALGIDSLTTAEAAFNDQTKPNGRPLGVPASVLLVPNALKVTAEQLMSSLTLNETTTANKAKPSNNPHAGKFKVANSAWLNNSKISGGSAKAWYLFADPNRLAAIEVAFLNGKQTPTVERANADFNTFGIQFRGFIDFGTKEQDYRGALKVKGEA